MVSLTTVLPTEGTPDSQAIQDWLDSYADQYEIDEQKTIQKACSLAQQSHLDTQLPSGESQLLYALSCADILARMKMDPDTLCAALLHNCPDSKQTSAEIITDQFGKTVADMIEDLTRINRLTTKGADHFRVDEEDHAENLRRLLLNLAKDVRVVLVVVAERLHLMRSIKSLKDQKKRHQIATETLDIYAPLANRLGIWQIKWELEDLCLRDLQPTEYKKLAKQLNGQRRERESFIKEVIATLDTHLKNTNITADITGRPKHIYSIWKKMHRKNLGFDQIFDIRAIRVLVKDVAQCYAALGIVHGLWRHIPGEFDDYIATPKTNMYQSLHTAVIGPDEKPLEIQIRTPAMHHHAELGVAAHWRYKENAGHDSDFEKRVVWMRQWLEQKENPSTDEGTDESAFSEMEPDQVYVLTPQAKVIELPKGSTPLDFAYTIHTDIGHRCRGARVNGRITPLTYELQSGDNVDIITQNNAQPSRDWLSPHLGYLRTSRAKNRVRHWFKTQDYEQHLATGRSVLDKEIQRLGLSGKPDLAAIAEKHNFKKEDDVLAAIGRGEISALHVAGTIGQPDPIEKIEHPAATVTSKSSTAVQGEIIVEGVGDLMTHMARCCKPVPYDPITGFITRGHGISIHRSDCPTLIRIGESEQQRLIQVAWGDQSAETAYPVDIIVNAGDRKGLLRDISSILTNNDIDVIGVKTTSNRKKDQASMRFTVEITDISQLSLILDRISQLPDVMEVRRQT